MIKLSMQHARRTLWTAVMFTLLTASQSFAGGGQHYPNGAEDFAVGALPPPGTYLVNYLIFAQKKTIKDNSGNSALPPGASFKGDVVVEVPRLIYVSPFTVLGANWGAHIFVPFYSADLQAGTAGAGGIGSHSNIIDSREKGIGDIIFSPAVFGWHFSPNLHAVAALDIYAPTGNYKVARPATQIISRNIWTVEPVLAVSYLKNGFDISAKFMYDFNSENDDTDTEPGQEFHMDWALGYGVKSGLSGGLIGYNYWQTTDDEVNGVEVQDQKGRIGGIGFGIKYWPKMGPFSMTFKQYWEYGGRNLPSGQQTQLKIAYAF